MAFWLVHRSWPEATRGSIRSKLSDESKEIALEWQASTTNSNEVYSETSHLTFSHSQGPLHWKKTSIISQIQEIEYWVKALYTISGLNAGSPSSKYVVYATACVYRELYGKIADRKKKCVSNYLIWNKVFLPQMCRELISCADLLLLSRRRSNGFK